MKKLICLFLLCDAAIMLTYAGPVHSGQQSYNVTGRFLCGTKKAQDVVLKLLVDDVSDESDVILNRGTSDENGVFAIEGSREEATPLNVWLYVYHDCNDGAKKCQRQWKFELDEKYITEGARAAKTMNIGTWNLEAIMPNEGRACVLN